MVYRVLADLVLVIHLVFIIFVVVGGLFTLFWRWTPFVHLPAALWGFFVEVSGRICPLTPLENSFRQSAGDQGYSGGFIEYYLISIIYPAELSSDIQFVLAGLVVFVNVLAYTFVWWRRKTLRSCPIGT